MPQYDGIVTRTGTDGRATVVMAPEQPGIPGASGLKVCHCAAASATIHIEALNAAGAGVGDHVTVNRPGGSSVDELSGPAGLAGGKPDDGDCWLPDGCWQPGPRATCCSGAADWRPGWLWACVSTAAGPPTTRPR